MADELTLAWAERIAWEAAYHPTVGSLRQFHRLFTPEICFEVIANQRAGRRIGSLTWATEKNEQMFASRRRLILAADG